jgi:hypothetical protein
VPSAGRARALSPSSNSRLGLNLEFKKGAIDAAEILGYAVWVDGTPGPIGLGIESFEHVSAGTWRIWFSFSVANAVEIASIGHYQKAGCITAYGEPPLGANEVTVVTFDPAYEVPVDLTFQLLVVA